MPDAQIDRRTVVIGAAALTAGLTVAGCATGAGSAPAASSPLATADVPVGGATIFADRAVVVTQATAGSFAAFSTVCPHQGCNVNAVEGAEIVCPCHDSRFDLTGAVLTGPAESGLAAVPVTVSGSELTLD